MTNIYKQRTVQRLMSNEELSDGGYYCDGYKVTDPPPDPTPVRYFRFYPWETDTECGHVILDEAKGVVWIDISSSYSCNTQDKDFKQAKMADLGCSFDDLALMSNEEIVILLDKHHLSCDEMDKSYN